MLSLDIHAGDTWEAHSATSLEKWGKGTGLVFFADSGMFMAVDVTDGKPHWQFQTSQAVKASPMAYEYVAIAGGSNIRAFVLPQ